MLWGKPVSGSLSPGGVGELAPASTRFHGTGTPPKERLEIHALWPRGGAGPGQPLDDLTDSDKMSCKGPDGSPYREPSRGPHRSLEYRPMTAPADSGRESEPGRSVRGDRGGRRRRPRMPSRSWTITPPSRRPNAWTSCWPTSRTRADSGSPIPIEHYLQACPGVAADPALKLDLVLGEILHQSRLGRSPDRNPTPRGSPTSARR